MENNIIISEDQNTITCGDIIVTFEELESDPVLCRDCILFSESIYKVKYGHRIFDICDIAPCTSALRRDGKDGVFK